jgi:hypothetical protein
MPANRINEQRGDRLVELQGQIERITYRKPQQNETFDP